MKPRPRMGLRPEDFQNAAEMPAMQRKRLEDVVATTRCTPNFTETQSFSTHPAVIPDLPVYASDYAYRLNQAVLDEAEDGIYGLDPEGLVTFANPAAQRLTGWSLDDLKGRTQHSVVHHSRPDGSHYPQQDCHIYQALRDGLVHHREDEVFWRKDGTSFPVSYTSVPVLRHGLPCGAVIIFRDNSARLREQAWQHSKSEIYSSIRERKPIPEILSRVSEAFAVLVGA